MKEQQLSMINRRSFISAGCRAIGSMALGGSAFVRCADSFLFSEPLDMRFVRPARHWKTLTGSTVLCELCPNGCALNDGETGKCKARRNIGGRLHTIVYSRITAAYIDPVEKKPFFHVLPGSSAYSVATAGCNLSCAFCQNWELSQSKPEDLEAELITPADLSLRAGTSGSKIIAFTYNEPTTQFEYIIDAAAVAQSKGLRPVIVSNGYINPVAGRELASCLTAVKIDLKAFTEKFYSDICGGSLSAVLKNLEAVYAARNWLEIVVLVIPTLNDSPSEIKAMTSWIARNLSPDIPVHFTRFHAMYKMQNLPPTPPATLERCRTIAREQGIRYAYIGNLPGHRWENTYCHSCETMIIKRSGYFSVVNEIKNGCCPRCRTRIPGVWT